MPALGLRVPAAPSDVTVGGFDVDAWLVEQGLWDRNADNAHCPDRSFDIKRKRAFAGKQWFGVRYSGRCIELQNLFDTQYKARGGGKRGKVQVFSWASRRRLVKAVASIPWELFPDRLFVTLTYPAEFPVDGRETQAHFAAWQKRFERRYGVQGPLVWKREYQSRGAVHYHLLVTVRFDTLMRRNLDDFRAWCSNAWFEVVASGDLRHLQAGTQVQRADTDCARYFAYGAKSTGSKEYQNSPPAGHENCGRFWGVRWHSPRWHGHVIPRSEFVELRRRLRKWRVANNGRASKRSALVGEWYLTPGRSSGMVLAQLARGLSYSALAVT